MRDDAPRKCGHFRYGAMAAALLFGLGSSAYAQPSLDHISPASIRPGQVTDITFSGKELAGITSIWTSSGTAEVAKEPAKNGENPVQVVLKVTMPAMPPGMLGLRVATAKGISELALLMVDDLPAVVDAGQNKTSSSAQSIAIPATITARIAGKGERRYYRFSGKEKQRIAIDIFAHRLGERFDPVATLYDSAGREIASCDDDLATRQDARFVVDLPAAGDYTLEVRDIRYREGRFVARISDAYFANIPPASAGEVVAEKEPNDRPESATAVPLTSIIQGAINSPGDRDCFLLTMKKGERIVASNLSRGLFSPGDFVIRILKEDGARLAEIDDRENGGASRLEFTAPADGAFLLAIDEADRRGGPNFAYRLDLRPADDAVRLRAKVDRFVTRVGGTFSVLLERDRPGYDGPIEISLAEPIPGVELSNRIHSKKMGEERLLVTVPGDAKQGELRPFRLIAKRVGANGPGELVSTETTAIGAPRRFLLATQLDGQMAFGIAGEALPLFTLTSTTTELPFDRASGTAKFGVTIDRTHKDYKETPIILAEGLPSGATIEGKKKSDTEIDVVITAPKDLPTGRHLLKVIGFGEFQNRGHQSGVGMTLLIP